MQGSGDGPLTVVVVNLHSVEALEIGQEATKDNEVVNSGDKLKSQAKHEFNTIATVLNKAYDLMEVVWFAKTEEPTIGLIDDLNNMDF